jgi:RNA polymerase sigma factor (sigma-70 family)
VTQPSTADLVAAAARGDEAAWAEIVTRYTPLVLSVIAPFRLGRADAADVNQTVWLRLVENLGRLREPAALAGWIATATRREALRVLRAGLRTRPYDPLDPTPTEAPPSQEPAPDDSLLRAERRQALRDGFAQLPPRCQHLLAMLVSDPPLTYQEISVKMGVPPGSIGPTRVRCLHKLRTCPALVTFFGTDDERGDRRDVASVGR